MSNEQGRFVAAVVDEFSGEAFADARLNKRLRTTVRGVLRDPAAGLPTVLTSAELEGAYRFFSNVAVTPEEILHPQMERMRQRCERDARVRIVHDTTEFSYRRDGRRQGFEDDGEEGYQSFFAHVSLALGSTREPLGIAGLLTWPRGAKRSKPAHSCWWQQVQASAQQVGATRPIHIADAAADDYELLNALTVHGHRFVIRSAYDRWTQDADEVRQKLSAAMATVPHVVEREARLGFRRRETNDIRRKQHPPRTARMANLHISAAAIALVRPASAVEKAKRRGDSQGGDLPPQLTVHVVRAWEPQPPEGAQPVEWLLLTNEPIDTVEQVLAIVDDYRARWTIEEFFKALKTGCAFEKRQLQDYESLVNALALFLPIACKMLALRTRACVQPEAPASAVASDLELEVLRSRLARRKLPDAPTVRDVLLCIAALGGHIKYAPDPGWLTLARGYEKLETYVEAWTAATLQPHSDQR